MSTSINNAFIKRSMYMPKGIGYGASSMGKVKKAAIVAAPKYKKAGSKATKEGPKKAVASSGMGAKRTVKSFKKRTRKGM